MPHRRLPHLCLQRIGVGSTTNHDDSKVRNPCSEPLSSRDQCRNPLPGNEAADEAYNEVVAVQADSDSTRVSVFRMEAGDVCAVGDDRNPVPRKAIHRHQSVTNSAAYRDHSRGSRKHLPANSSRDRGTDQPSFSPKRPKLVVQTSIYFYDERNARQERYGPRDFR